MSTLLYLLTWKNKCYWDSFSLVAFYLGEWAKIATVIFKMDNFGTRNFNDAKPDIINQNGTNLTLLNIGVKFDL